MHAATTKNAADDGSPGTSSSNGSGAPASTRTVPSAGRHRRTERREHALGVIAARDRFDDLGHAPRLEAGEHERTLHLRARDARRVPAAGERAAAHDDRRQRAVGARVDRRAHRAQRLDDARHRAPAAASRRRRAPRGTGAPRAGRSARASTCPSWRSRSRRPARAEPSTPFDARVSRSGEPLIRTPSCSRLRRVAATSAPVARPAIVLRPSASAANSSARCEIDLSPGTRNRPRSGRAPPTTTSFGALMRVPRVPRGSRAPAGRIRARRRRLR